MGVPIFAVSQPRRRSALVEYLSAGRPIGGEHGAVTSSVRYVRVACKYLQNCGKTAQTRRRRLRRFEHRSERTAQSKSFNTESSKNVNNLNDRINKNQAYRSSI